MEDTAGFDVIEGEWVASKGCGGGVDDAARDIGEVVGTWGNGEASVEGVLPGVAGDGVPELAEPLGLLGVPELGWLRRSLGGAALLLDQALGGGLRIIDADGGGKGVGKPVAKFATDREDTD